MNRTTLAALTLFGFLTAAGHAQAGRSGTPELFYQPNVNGVELTTEYHQYLSAATSTSSGGVKTNDVKFGNTGYFIRLGYAFSDAWAFRASMSMDSSSTDYTDTSEVTSSATASGMSDMAFMLTNITPVGGWNLNVGLGAALSQSPHLDAVVGGSSGNNMSGGTSIINYLGLSTALGSANYVGVKAQYTTRMQQAGSTNANPGVTYTVVGGNNTGLEAFYEMDFTPVDFDFRAGYFLTDGSLKTYSSGTTATVDATKYTQFALGAQYQVMASTNFRLEYSMSMYPEVVATGVAAYSVTQLTARLRFEF